MNQCCSKTRRPAPVESPYSIVLFECMPPRIEYIGKWSAKPSKVFGSWQLESSQNCVLGVFLHVVPTCVQLILRKSCHYRLTIASYSTEPFNKHTHTIPTKKKFHTYHNEMKFSRQALLAVLCGYGILMKDTVDAQISVSAAFVLALMMKPSYGHHVL